MNRIKLDQALADRLATLLNDVKRSRYELAKVVSDVRSQYLDPRTKKYAPEFTEFWKKFRMTQSFGSLSQFTKYAAAGDVIEWVRENKPEALPTLPNSIKSLYEISQLEADQRHRLLEATSPQSVSAKKLSQDAKAEVPSPLVQPALSATAIASWKKRELAPRQSPVDPPPIKLAEIWIHGSFGSYAEDGSYTGKIDPEKLAEVVQAVRGSLARQDPSAVWITSTKEDLLNRIRTARDRTQAKSDGVSGIKTARIKTMLLELLRKQGEEIDQFLIPNSFSKEVVAFRIPLTIKEQYHPAFKKKFDAFIVEPTAKEFRYILAEEYLKRVGAKKLLALICRARGEGIWKDMITYPKEVKERKRDPKTGVVTYRYRTKHIIESVVEKELRDLREKIKFNVGIEHQAESTKSRIEEIENYLTEDLRHKRLEALELEAKNALTSIK